MARKEDAVAELRRAAPDQMATLLARQIQRLVDQAENDPPEKVARQADAIMRAIKTLNTLAPPPAEPEPDFRPEEAAEDDETCDAPEELDALRAEIGRKLGLQPRCADAGGHSARAQAAGSAGGGGQLAGASPRPSAPA